ncbi:MAG: MbnP family protein [Saprospiraceae bacterium]
MKNSTLLLTIFALFMWSSCGDQGAEETGIDFDITFKATFDGAQLEKSKDYQLGSIPLFFEACRLYVSDITLLNGDKEILLSEIEYFDFTPANATFATPTITFNNVPEGQYTGIRIGYGVKPDLNAKTPSYFRAGHPLAVETDYWSSWNSYIFSTLDGKADSDNNGSKNLSFAYHCGSDAVYKTFEFTVPIHVHEGEAGARVTFDIKKFLTMADGTLYDIVANPATSNTLGNVTVAQALMANYGRATSVEQ